ncbi:hypothetical protein [Lactobacillus sp. ESL0681]|uniref:hypothetical protein n=1 Tax=Lactobacillus sp. ESL0681 TaxID=2983211 RepID=UPI0023F726F9|nr:hypothetical protein [Lactobacillus sp. ESL0681]WEV41323.1 hypothetical protein OZX59_09345 [Lactobacillus sp. ESL0681]
MNDDQKVNLGSKYVIEIVYIFFSVKYLINLNVLNESLNELIKHKHISSFAIIEYNNYEPIGYFIEAIVIMVIAILLVWWFFHSMSFSYFSVKYFKVLFWTSLLINIVIVIFTIKLIQIPILKALLTVGSIGLGIFACSSEN